MTKRSQPAEPLVVVCDEETKRVFAGTLNQDQDGVNPGAQDVTDSAVVAIADLVFWRGGALEIKLDDDNSYQIEVVRIGRTRDGGRIALLPDGTVQGLPDDFRGRIV